jgi:transposase
MGYEASRWSITVVKRVVYQCRCERCGQTDIDDVEDRKWRGGLSVLRW